MTVGILKEKEGDNRVSVLPELISGFISLKLDTWVEAGAGERLFEADDSYASAGAVIKTRAEMLAQCNMLLSINPLATDDINKLKPGTVLLGVYQPLFNFQLMHTLAGKNITTFSLDMLPRNSRAQSMDVLSSQASIAGYKAVLEAANIYGRYFPMLMTAAGTITPAKVLVLGAGVAGLQAVATAKRLGAVVEVFDTRPAVKEEVMSLGAKFVEVEGAADASKAGGYGVEQTAEYAHRQQQKIKESIARADIVITTAQIPGKRAPVLIPVDMVEGMKPGSVIVDLAAATGGNCALTKNNETIIHNGVTIVGNSNLASMVPHDASKLYGKNILNFIKLIVSPQGELNINFEDELIAGACITHNNQMTNARVKEIINYN